jgi:hypothetical protein
VPGGAGCDAPRLKQVRLVADVHCSVDKMSLSTIEST